MAIQILQLVHPWCENERVMAVTHKTSSFGEGPMAESVMQFRCIRKQNLKHALKAHRHLQCWSRRLARAQFQTKHRLWCCELPDSVSCESYASYTIVTQTTSIIEPSLIETMSVTKCSKIFMQPFCASFDISRQHVQALSEQVSAKSKPIHGLC